MEPMMMMVAVISCTLGCIHVVDITQLFVVKLFNKSLLLTIYIL